ncbi:MAG: hypothetical protein K2X69_15315, partial [Silvanigrellaceae bacterium]|nr:hypothetical protein [Silvanigrellaceae bacterium]
SSLFFNIGAELNREAENVHSIDKKSILIQEIADSLQPIFGNHLCSQNLFLMSKFADECSSEKRRFVAAIINWDYLPYFLNLTEDDEWVFYSDLIYSKSLTPIELGRKISDKTFEKTEKKLSTDKYDFMFKKAYAFYRSTLELYFGKEGRDSFRKLFEPQDVHKDYQDNLTTKKTVHNELLLSIYTKITEFQSEYNHQLNLGFNILIWALGVEIIKLSKSSKAKNINDVIDLCIQEFSNDLPSIFNQKELSHCIDFVNEYGENNNPPIELMQILPWAYLKILIKIEGYENQFLLANQILKNGVSIQELEKLISDGSFNLEKAKQELEKITMNNSVAEIITKEKNFTATGTMSIIEPIVNLENDLNRNIYKNPDLLAFLAHNAYMNDRTLK